MVSAAAWPYAALLMSKPDMLLLDEPTNHLDAESVGWLEQFLDEYPGTVVAITHDRYFLDNCAQWILELDRGHGIHMKATTPLGLETKEALSARRNKKKPMPNHRARAGMVRKGARGRQTKSKARLAAFEEMNSREFQARNETNEIYIPPGPRLGDKVIEFHNVSKAYGDRVLIDDLSFTVPAGAIVGIIGGNGAGKSTLFRMIAGVEQPDSGSVVVGETVKLAFVEQLRDQLDDKKTVWEAISDGLDMLNINGKEYPQTTFLHWPF